MTKLNIIGTYFGQSGYDSHTRQLALALNKLCEVSISTQRPANWARLMEDNEFQMLIRNPNEAEVNLCIGLPYNWNSIMSDGKPFIGFVVWEGNKCPNSWLETFMDDRVDLIFVPSEHTKQAILNTLETHKNDY